MTTYSVAEAKAKLTKLLVAAERGEDVTITRRGKAVAQLVPKADAQRGRMTPELMALLDSFTEDDVPLERSSVDILREMRDEGP